MSYLDWKVGDKIVCIDDQWHDPTDEKVCPLVAGAVYTVVRIFPGTGLYRGGIKHVAIEVGEINRPQGFAAPRFRPVQKRKTDISVFTRLLTHPRVTIGEDA